MTGRVLAPRLYAIVDAEALGPGRFAGAASRLARAGVEWLQLRAKALDDRSLLAEAKATLESLGTLDSPETGERRLWINDRPDVAAMSGAQGVHLGQDDLEPGEARAVLPGGVLIGHSTHDRAQVQRAAQDDAVDVIAIGPIFETASKAGAGLGVGLDFVALARRLTDKPLVAIGGIGPGNARSVLDAGADTVAVLGALCRGDLEANAARMLTAVGA